MSEEVERLQKSMLNILKNSEERRESPGAVNDNTIKFQENPTTYTNFGKEIF